MRAEWAINRARARRWEEEVELLLEEMTRGVAFFEYLANVWMKRIGTRPDARGDIQSGLNSYAYQKHTMYSLLASSCKKKWRAALKECKLADLWPSSPEGTEALAALVTGLEDGLVSSVGDVVDDDMDGPDPDDQ